MSMDEAVALVLGLADWLGIDGRCVGHTVVHYANR